MYPKQPGQDADAHRKLAQANLGLRVDLDALKAKLLGSEECLETWKSAAEKWEAEVKRLDAVILRKGYRDNAGPQ